MSITFTIEQIEKAISLEDAKQLEYLKEYAELSMGELTSRGFNFALACITLYAPKYNAQIRMFAHDCIQILRSRFADHPARFITPAYTQHGKLLTVFEVASDTIYRHAYGIADDVALKDVVNQIEVPHESHQDFHPRMALGYALQLNIAKNIKNVCEHVIKSAIIEKDEFLYRAHMTLALRKRF